MEMFLISKVDLRSVENCN